MEVAVSLTRPDRTGPDRTALPTVNSYCRYTTFTCNRSPLPRGQLSSDLQPVRNFHRVFLSVEVIAYRPLPYGFTNAPQSRSDD
jgi:hypothetical protein